MERETLKVTWDDVNSPTVDAKLKQQQSSARQETLISPALAMSQKELKNQQRASIWYNTLFAMTVFGFVGGLLAWSVGELVQINPPTLKQAASHIEAVRNAREMLSRKTIGQPEFDALVQVVEREAAQNPYYRILRDKPEDSPQRKREIEAQQAVYRQQEFIAKVLRYGLVGMLVALALGVAEPLIDRNRHVAMINGAVGATLGLVGGVIVSLFVDSLHVAMGGGGEATSLTATVIIADAIKYGVVGLFLTIGPGIVMRNFRKLSVGLGGGMIGGIVGGAMLAPVAYVTSSAAAGRAVAPIAIGAIAGLATGLIENAAKTGWLKVVQGLIAGKQFILYRAQTFIGSAPDCHIYLFKDPKVGRRHAVIHVVSGGFELEDLPLGTPTFVNGQTITRRRLRSGDQIQVGSTIFSFQEKVKEVAGASKG